MVAAEAAVAVGVAAPVLTAAQLDGQLSEARIEALRAQINPHFLFNALNTIASLIHTDPGQAETTVERLAEMFRYVLADSERGWVPLREELAGDVHGALEVAAAVVADVHDHGLDALCVEVVEDLLPHGGIHADSVVPDLDRQAVLLRVLGDADLDPVGRCGQRVLHDVEDVKRQIFHVSNYEHSCRLPA